MNKKLKKIAAFTLSEMLVVLLITVIVVGLAFSVLQLTNNHMYSIQENYEEKTELNLLRQALWIDFNTYRHISYHPESNTLSCKNEIASVSYYLGREMIIRQQDTFNISANNKVLYLEGLEQSSGVIDAMALLIRDKKRERKIFVYKKNDATLHMNHGL